MITFTVKLHVNRKQRKEVYRALRAILGPTRVLQGCIDCRVYRDIEDANLLMLVQKWEHHENLILHTRTLEFRQVLATIDLSLQTPDIQYSITSEDHGLEILRALLETPSQVPSTPF